ncbi:MAG: endolytic transglycosylase MltG [Betaproteobacteria bacterium]|nr:endolytic transglycosylase MltG [Betaproteobacteria bacterium]
MLRRFFRWAAFLFCLALAFCAWMAWFALAPASLARSPTDFSIRTGSSLRSATRQMIDAGVDLPAWQFNLLARLAGGATGIKAGSYELVPGTSPWEILEKITSGDFAQAEVLLVEGWTFHQVRAALDANAWLKHDTEGLSDAAIMARLGEAGRHPEGLFFPDTYLFGKGESDLTVLARARDSMQKQLQSLWQKRAPDVPLASPYEALILASIIEKETGAAAERAQIAGVFANRLRIGMRLQTDPTVIYGLGKSFDGNLRKRDLERDGPYNTYIRSGLPPSPISNPGLASLLAAVNPGQGKWLYFVSRNDGTSEFSRSLDEHNRAVARYQRPAGR